MSAVSESVSARVAADHANTVCVEDRAWFIGLLNRVEREVRMELSGVIERAILCLGDDSIGRQDIANDLSAALHNEPSA